MSKKRSSQLCLPAVERVLGRRLSPLGAIMQVVACAALLILLSEGIDSMLTGWRGFFYPGMGDIYQRMQESLPSLVRDWPATVKHLAIGLLGSIPAFLLAIRLAMWRWLSPAVVGVVAFAMSYPKLAMSVNFLMLTRDNDLTIYLFGWWASGLYAFAIAFFLTQRVIEGGHDEYTHEARDLALLHYPKKSQFYLRFLLPHMLPRLPYALMISSATICGSFLFTEALVQVPGLGTRGDQAVVLQDMPWIQVNAIALGMTNMVFWAGIYLLQRYYDIFGQTLSWVLDRSAGRRKF